MGLRYHANVLSRFQFNPIETDPKQVYKTFAGLQNKAFIAIAWITSINLSKMFSLSSHVPTMKTLVIISQKHFFLCLIPQYLEKRLVGRV